MSTITDDDPTAWAEPATEYNAGEPDATGAGGRPPRIPATTTSPTGGGDDGAPITAPKPEPPRDWRGRYLIPGPKGTTALSYTRATTVAKTLADTYGLEQWQMRQVASGMAARPDLIELAAAHSPDDDAKVYEEIVENALEASGSAAGRRRGTALHRLTELVDLGLPLPKGISDDFRARLDAYRQKMEEKGIEVHRQWIERILVLDGYQIAGTTDRIVTLSCGRRVIADLKTAKPDKRSGKLARHGRLEIAVQLAIYANHDATYDPLKDRRGKRIDVDRTVGIIIHLPSEGPVRCDIYQIDLAKGWDALITAMEVREWRATKDLVAEYTPLAVGTGGASAVRDWLGDRVKRLKAEHPAAYRDLVDNRWPQTVPRPFPTEPALYQIEDFATALDRVEASHGVPLGPTRPGVPTPTKQTTRKNRKN